MCRRNLMSFGTVSFVRIQCSSFFTTDDKEWIYGISKCMRRPSNASLWALNKHRVDFHNIINITKRMHIYSDRKKYNFLFNGKKSAVYVAEVEMKFQFQFSSQFSPMLCAVGVLDRAVKTRTCDRPKEKKCSFTETNFTSHLTEWWWLCFCRTWLNPFQIDDFLLLDNWEFLRKILLGRKFVLALTCPMFSEPNQHELRIRHNETEIFVKVKRLAINKPQEMHKKTAKKIIFAGQWLMSLEKENSRCSAIY